MFFTPAWGTLFQRFGNTLVHGDFPGAFSKDFGIVVTDATSGTKLTRIMRKIGGLQYQMPGD